MDKCPGKEHNEVLGVTASGESEWGWDQTGSESSSVLLIIFALLERKKY